MENQQNAGNQEDMLVKLNSSLPQSIINKLDTIKAMQGVKREDVLAELISKGLVDQIRKTAEENGIALREPSICLHKDNFVDQNIFTEICYRLGIIDVNAISLTIQVKSAEVDKRPEISTSPAPENTESSTDEPKAVAAESSHELVPSEHN
ncbi:MAG: hypothetical protein PHI97_18710 [Desulfobulbus sp.]|jgi:hypothetical protein|nr:hypothetical protein [Desulfobulbus sp.]